MSALGHKRTSRSVEAMSALPPIADIGTKPRNVCFVPKADIPPSQSISSTQARDFFPVGSVMTFGRLRANHIHLICSFSMASTQLCDTDALLEAKHAEMRPSPGGLSPHNFA